MLNTNEVRNGVIVQVEQNFSSIPIYGEEPSEGSVGPYFYVKVVSIIQNKEVDRRYKRVYTFDIQYFPDFQAIVNEVMYEAAETLFAAMEYLILDNRVIKGTGMRCERVEQVLHFYVDYSVYTAREREGRYPMQRLEQEGAIKDE